MIIRVIHKQTYITWQRKQNTAEYIYIDVYQIFVFDLQGNANFANCKRLLTRAYCVKRKHSKHSDQH